MKTVGQLLKEARAKKRYSLARLEELTKIKKDFIEALERESWGSLPAFSTVLGFVKSLSTTLKIDANMAVAVLKRDYPPRSEAVNPKPDISSKFVWGPKLTFGVGVGMVLIAIAGYLGFQYKRFVSPPSLTVYQPKNEQVVTNKFVIVEGTTDTDAKVTVNNQPLIIDQDGKFKIELEVAKETKEVVVKAISRSGKETTVRRSILVSSN